MGVNQFRILRIFLVLALICGSTMGTGTRPLTLEEIRQLKESGALSRFNTLDGLPIPTTPISISTTTLKVLEENQDTATSISVSIDSSSDSQPSHEEGNDSEEVLTTDDEDDDEDVVKKESVKGRKKRKGRCFFGSSSSSFPVRQTWGIDPRYQFTQQYQFPDPLPSESSQPFSQYQYYGRINNGQY